MTATDRFNLLRRAGVWQSSVAAGKWSDWYREEVVIPATAAYEGGIWFHTRQGMLGMLVTARAGKPVVYLVIEPASHDYLTMTKATHMPVLIGERIQCETPRPGGWNWATLSVPNGTASAPFRFNYRPMEGGCDEEGDDLSLPGLRQDQGARRPCGG